MKASLRRWRWLSMLLVLLGFCFGFSSGTSLHHNHNEGFEGRKVRRIQRFLLHNNRHTMQFRSQAEDEDDADFIRSLRSTLGNFAKPDECPPRQTDTVQDGINGQKRTCPRKCASDSDCLNDRKLCLCDGACGLSCIRPEKECPELPDPPHGQVHLTGRHFNDRAVYTCDDGYQIVGLEQVICNSNGKWSGTQPSCKQGTSSSQSRYYCGTPTVIPHAKHNGSSEQMFYDLDTELSYQCDPGYKRKGFQVAQCFFYNGTARWFGPDLTCHPIDCGPPEEILNGKRTGDCTTYRCQMKYDCVPGFELVGKDTRYCQSDGTWTPSELPTCVPVQCGLPESPANGKAHYTALAYKSVVTYTCKYGFMAVGDATRTCGEDKQWSGVEPKCKEINCGSPGRLPNGWLEGARMNLGDVVNFKCVDGMKFEGESLSTTCQDDGTWSHPLPKCLSPCIVPDVPMGRVANHTSYRNSVMHGENISIQCTRNFELEGNVTQITCNNGTFDRMPKCEPARCKTLPAPPNNGMVVVPNTRHGGTGLYQCKDGFILKGENTTKCDFGNWTGETPICQLVYCPFPGYIVGGKVLLVGNMGLYDYRPYVKKVKNNRQIMFECGRGSKLVDGPPGATCIDGKWSPETLPRCEVEYHPKMAWLSKRSAAEKVIRIPKRAKRSLGRRQRSSISSDGGGSSNFYGNIDSQRHRRGANRDADRDCQPLTDENLDIEVIKAGRDVNGDSASHAKGSVLKVSCGNAGFKLNLTKRKIRCKRGEWRPGLPQCVPIGCTLPNLPEVEGGGGHFTLGGQSLSHDSQVSHGEDVDVVCHAGYFLSGPSRLRCWFGDWSGGSSSVFGMPKCVGNPCILPNISGTSGGKYRGIKKGADYQAGQVIPHDALIDFECPGELRDPNSPPLQCKLGHLIPTNPHCGVLGHGAASDWRGNLEVSASSHVVFNGDLDLDSAQLDLEPEEERLSNTLIINDNATPSPNEDSEVACQRPQHMEGTLIYKGNSKQPLLNEEQSNLPHGTEVRFDCIKAKQRSWKIICHNGRWIGFSLGCDKNGSEVSRPTFNGSCPFSGPLPESHLATFYDLSEVKSGSEEVIYEPGAELLFRCVDIGKYRLEGSSRRRCVGGSWDGEEAVCVGLSQHHDYSTEEPPTILFRFENGAIAQSNVGELVVAPGTTLHMECLFKRKYGNPAWFIDNYSGRTYPQSWTSAPGRDSSLEYRLSIYHARVNDTGIYTCDTPFQQAHTINIVVKDVKCPNIEATEGLKASSLEAVGLSAEVTFECTNGNSLIGAPKVKCLPSGIWDHPIPACQDIVCPENITLWATSLRPHLKVQVHSFGAGGHAFFSCQRGHTLVGTKKAKCLRNGEWSVALLDVNYQKDQLPQCHPIICSEPPAPENGMIKYEGPLKVGRIVKFHCNPGFMMTGRPIMTCSETTRNGQNVGHWTPGQPPKCQRACVYPGSLIGGKMLSPVKFYYPIGFIVNYECAPGLDLSGASKLECLNSGAWSSAVPLCSKATA